MTADLKNEAQKALDAYDKYESHRDALQFAAAIESLRKAVELQAPAEAHSEPREPAPLNDLPSWSECDLIIANHEFRQRAAAGLEGAVLDLPEVTPTPTALHRFIHEYDDADPYRSDWFMHRLELVVKEAQANVQPKHTAPERLLAQVREVCAATLRAGPGVAVSLPAELAEEGRKFMRGEPSLIEQLPFADVQKLGDVLNETPATVQAPAPAPETGDTNGRRDGLRSAVHGRVPVGGHTPGALADLLWASPDVMGLNAELGLTMDQLVQLTQAVLTAVPCAAVAHQAPPGYRLITEEFMDWIGALPEAKAQRRLEWLHSPESNNVDGYEWGVYRVKWEHGKAVEVWHTNSDFSDLDAAMASQPPVQGSEQ